MGANKYRLLSSLLFITVLLVKVLLCVSPAFFEIKNQTVIQLDKDNKSDKDDSDKDTSKDKKSFSEDFVCYIQNTETITPAWIGEKLHFKQPLYLPDYYTIVQTPPPDRSL